MPLENTMEVFFGEFHLNKDSSVRFQKAVMFHYASQSIESSEQRLTGMWTLLESLLPRHPAYHATSMITPALILIYFEKLLRYTWLTLRECPKQVRRLIKKIDVGGNHLEKLAAILSCEEYEDERIKLCEMLSRFPLRRNSLFELHKILGDPKQMSRILCQHEQRITHHLYRIYSSRNFITHQASSLPYTESIVEHLHHYIDVLMFSIIEIAVTGDEPISIEQILAQLKAYSSNHVKMLATETTKSNKENYLRYVFGVNNPLSVMNRRSHKRKEFIFPFGKWDNVEND